MLMLHADECLLITVTFILPPKGYLIDLLHNHLLLKDLNVTDVEHRQS